MFKLVTLIALLICGAHAHAAVYKWVDGDGRVHYSALPPGGVSYEKLATAPAPDQDPEAAMEALRAKVEAVEKGADAPEQSEQASKTAKSREQRRKENCERARANLEALESDKDILQADADGNKVVLNEQQRKVALDQTRKDLTYYCT